MNREQADPSSARIWHTPCEWTATMNSIFYIIGVVVVIVIILKLLGLF